MPSDRERESGGGGPVLPEGGVATGPIAIGERAGNDYRSSEPDRVPVVLAHALQYSPRYTSIRCSRWLTALGVGGVVAGLISLIASGSAAFEWGDAYWRSRPPVVVLPAVLPGVKLPQYTGDTIGTLGLNRADRQRMLAKIRFDGPFAADQREMLDRMLRECGQEMLLPGEAAERWSGQIDSRPRVEFNEQAQVGLRNRRITMLGGSILVDRAEVRLSGPRGDWELKNNRIKAPGGRPIPTIAGIDAAISQARVEWPGLTAGHIDGIAARCAAAAAVGADGEPSVQSLTEDGVALVIVGPSQYWVMRDGRSITVGAAPDGVDGKSGRPLTPPSTFTPAAAGLPGLMLAQSMVAGLSAIMALYLVASGVVTLMRPEVGARMQLRFVWGKAALVVAQIVLGAGYLASTSAHSLPGGFDMSAGAAALAMSVFAQACLLAGIAAVLYGSQGVLAYMRRLNGLWVLSPGYRGSLKRLLDEGRTRLHLVACAAVFILLAGLNLAAPAVWDAEAVGHVLLAIACLAIAGVAFWFWKMGTVRRARVRKALAGAARGAMIAVMGVLLFAGGRWSGAAGPAPVRVEDELSAASATELSTRMSAPLAKYTVDTEGDQLAGGGRIGRARLYEIIKGQIGKGTDGGRLRALRALVRKFPVLTPLETTVLPGREGNMDRNAAWATIGQIAEGAVEDPARARVWLVEKVISWSWVSASAAEVLVNIGGADASQMEPLLEAFGREGRSRLTVARVLFNMKEASEPVIQAEGVLMLLEKGEEQELAQMAGAIVRAGPSGIRAGLAALVDNRVNAGSAMRILQSFEAPAGPALARATSDLMDARFRREAATLLGMYLEDPQGALERHVAQLDSSDELAARVAAWGLRDEDCVGPVTGPKVMRLRGVRTLNVKVGLPRATPPPARPEAPGFVWMVTVAGIAAGVMFFAWLFRRAAAGTSADSFMSGDVHAGQ